MLIQHPAFIEEVKSQIVSQVVGYNVDACDSKVALISWRAGASNTMSVVRTVRLAIRPRASMPGERRTGLMGAARPQTPHRSPRQAFGGNSGQRPNVATNENRNTNEPAELQL